MANAVFTTSESSAYDDHPEFQYHFPKTYLNQAREAVGDWILYYEPRRLRGANDRSGRQAYFAVAKVIGIERDPNRDDHFYARMAGYLELDRPVAFREGAHYWESLLRRADGETNKGAFGRAVRLIPREEFDAIVQASLSTLPDPWEQHTDPMLPIAGINDHDDQPPDYGPRPLIQRLETRKFRDFAFRRHVRKAYDNTCAITGLRLINGGGRPEVQAAHIWPVEHDGPDTVRNGLALTGTAHWMFDRGLISVDDSYRIIVASSGVPDDLVRLMRPDRMLRLPETEAHRPHPQFLRWHRENRFKG
ncbi:HNH endonuclease [Arenimonas composti]|uniref:HNH nuclease domain-containing protein n=1 Tax=Arenimonas composti TR7-09 = DSM 18010 TaxID=1121013 RepID=A0A091B6D4_9GAMM|nr:HNH endonuclease [Arenimonas composti]KFN48228.1 hypothetical protein P873_01340 [Arenimonas composti TR7-09 = DSM 18010]